MIDFENQEKDEETNMKINEPELELTVEKSPEALWDEFEKTGSVQTYLQFLQKTKIQDEAGTATPSFRS